MKSVLSVLVGVMIIVTGSVAQQVSGTVSDINGEPLFGATVYEQITEVGASTDKNGYFEFDLKVVGQIQLHISSVGYAIQLIDTVIYDNDQMNVSITLEEKMFSLPQVVVESVTMTGGLQGIQKTLGSAHYIGQKEIQKFSYTDVNRTLRNIPGVNIQEEDGYGLRPNIGLRATGAERSSKITVMEDGILSAPAPYAAPSAYYFPTIGRMEAIEIMKGSSQIKYGPYTTGGAINFISTPIPFGFAGHADFIAGSNGYKMLHANLGNSHNNVAYVVETMQYSADGFKQLDNGGDTGFNKEDYLAKFRVNTNPDAAIYQSLTFKIGQSQERSNETYLGLTDADFILESPTDHQLAYDQIRGAADATSGLILKNNNRSYFSEGVQTNIILHKNTASAKHKLDIGFRVHHDQIDRFQWVDDYAIENGVMKLVTAGTPGTESNRVTDATAIATYAQYKLETGNWVLTPGLRYEHITISRDDYGKEDVDRTGVNLKSRENTVDVVIPGLAVGYKLTEEVKLFGGVHKGFAPPGSKEGTNPEESWNYEIGGKVNKNRWSTQVLGYFNNYSNLLGADLAAAGGQGSADLFNGGAAKAYGIEAEATYDLLSSGQTRLPISMAYTYSKATFGGSFGSEFDGWGDVQEGDNLPYVPTHQLSTTLSLEHEKLLFDVSGKYATEMLTEAGSFDSDAARTDEAFTIDISANYRLTSQISAFVNANNITNNIYVVARRPAGVRPNLPRTYNVGLKANF